MSVIAFPTTLESRSPRRRSVLVVEDGSDLSLSLAPVCDYFDVAVETVDEPSELVERLGAGRPLAIVCAVSGVGERSYATMCAAALHHLDMPVLMVSETGDKLGNLVADAAEYVGLSHVRHLHGRLSAKAIVDFLDRAGCLQAGNTRSFAA